MLGPVLFGRFFRESWGLIVGRALGSAKALTQA